MPVPFDTHAFITDMTQAGIARSASRSPLPATPGHLQRQRRHEAGVELAVAHLDTRFAAVDTRFATMEGQLESASRPSTPVLPRWKAS